jgi:hypothetical protein
MDPPIDDDRINTGRGGPVDHHQHQRHHGDDWPASPSILSKSYSFADGVSLVGSFMEQKVEDARPLLPKAAFFMGDLRDGLPMVRIDLRPTDRPTL